MKLLTLPLVLLVFFVVQVQPAEAQKTELKHTFKIVGNKRIPFYSKEACEMSVEYDTTSIDHLYMSEFKKNGVLKTRTRLLFKGEKFNLNKFSEYADQSKLLVDGSQYDFREDGSLGSELLYNEEKLQQKTFYYPNGNRQMLISGDEKIMSGEFKTWFLNSQLSFSGNYKDNLKDGEFQQFDQSGKLVKNGIYAGGVLISGEAVVQDIIFKSPDQPAKFPGGDKAFNDYLRMKTAELKIVKDLGKDEVNYINMNLTVSKTGTIDKIDIYGHSIPTENEISQWRGTARDGIYPETGLLNNWPAEGPRLKFKIATIGKGLSQTVVYKNLIYLTGLKSDTLDVISACDIDGKVLWEKTYSHTWIRTYPESRGTPTIEDNRIYLIGGMGDLVCLSTNGGEEIWRKEPLKDFEGQYMHWGKVKRPIRLFSIMETYLSPMATNNLPCFFIFPTMENRSP